MPCLHPWSGCVCGHLGNRRRKVSRLVWKTITCVPESEGLRRVRDNHPVSAESCSSSAGHPELFRLLGIPPRKFLKQGQFSVRPESRNTPLSDTPLLKGFWSKASWWGGVMDQIIAVPPTVSQWTANILFNGHFKLSSADLSKKNLNILLQYVLNI